MGLLDKARDAVKSAGELATKAVDEVKDKGHGMQLTRKLNALAEDLGHVVFRSRTGEAGLDAEIGRIVDEMSHTKAEIAALDETAEAETAP